jgi:NAD(P)-dependent dehydrogenase (short-subunit alcohol dehydrogenase family)
MDALIIGPASGLAGAIAGGLRRRGHSVLQALPADASDGERIEWLFDEAGRPGLVVVLDVAPYATTDEVLRRTHADVVLVAEHRAAAPGAAPPSYAPWPIGRGLKVVMLGRAGRRWFTVGSKRAEMMSAERAAALVVRACRPPVSAVVA